ncbi:MAG: fasciclin domain-containing protein [Actinobacteria bacterium]|nr:fasciclin domain-containing protein [Actinomycetota bacterium]
MNLRFKKNLAVVSLVSLLGAMAAPSALAAGEGTKSLASVLTAKSSFDKDSNNYDILTAAVLAVLKAKPMSPVKVLTDGSVALTAFIPNDGAFKKLVADLTGKAAPSEEKTFAAVAGLGIDTVEQVLQYHVVPGAAILSGDALKANGAKLTTALPGATISVKVAGTVITLDDKDPIAMDPTVILSQVDINKGNLQIAHGINAVLLPAALVKALGTNSLAAVLTAKSSFDKNAKNFDILTAAVLAVLKAKPNSKVKVLTDGSVALTAFIPTDGAFRALVKALTGKPATSEKAAFATVAGLGISKVEQILLFHVVPGATVVSEDALKSNGASLATALAGKKIKVSVMGTVISLGDYSALKDPKVILSALDINRGNRQIAHAIDAVLLPTK